MCIVSKSDLGYRLCGGVTVPTGKEYAKLGKAMPDLTSLLHSTFGHREFRANQEAVCRAATAGRDCLLVMPTGAGKSLCYQLPALARGGTGLVVSPLIALMDDQAAKLSHAGLRVGRIHSGLSREQSRQACRDYLDGALDFLFIAPERMRVPGFPEMLAKRTPALIAIDEAHCISAWGHDFRPDYRTLGDFLPGLRPAPIIALTATATPQVQKDIAAQLKLVQPALFIHGFRRDNLHIEVMELSKPQRAAFASGFLSDPARRPAIVYAPSRKAAEELASELGRKFPAAAYHAGLDPGTRERVQTAFQSGKLEVVVATIAFGMGIDKADVRTVVHYALPASVEAYYQEIGRAGRDGLPSRTVLLYTFADRKMHDFFLERDYPVATELTRVAKRLTDDFQMPEVLRQGLKMDAETFDKAVEKLASQGAAVTDMAGNIRRGGTTKWQSGYELQVAHRRGQIDAMMDYAQTQQCRMTALIKHFGDTADSTRPCGHCDFCNPTGTSAQRFVEPTAAEEKNLRTILRTLAAGSKSTGKLHSELQLTKERKDLDELLDGLARAGLITIANEQWTNPEGNVITFKKAAITHEGRELGEGDSLGVLLRSFEGGVSASPSAKKKKAKAEAKAAAGPLTPAQENLEAALRAWRKQEAAKTGKPAFIVFGDAALAALVQAAPKTIPELTTVSGFGPAKVEAYGAAITAICRNPDSDALPLPERAKPAAQAKAFVASSYAGRGAVLLEEPASLPEPAATHEPATFHRERPAERAPVASDPSRELDARQQDLDLKLREWRKAEAEKMGLPQFFVLGTSTLRSIVLMRPRTLAQLKTISGIDEEKVSRFGEAILAVCNG